MSTISAVLSNLSKVLVLCSLVAIGGCKQVQESDDVRALTKQLKDTLGEYTPSTEDTTKEVEKLFTYEYQVLSFERDTKPTAIQESMAGAGAERWDCFHVEERDEDLLVFCKRQPKTMLRYIPRVF